MKRKVIVLVLILSTLLTLFSGFSLIANAERDDTVDKYVEQLDKALNWRLNIVTSEGNKKIYPTLGSFASQNETGEGDHINGNDIQLDFDTKDSDKLSQYEIRCITVSSKVAGTQRHQSHTVVLCYSGGEPIKWKTGTNKNINGQDMTQEPIFLYKYNFSATQLNNLNTLQEYDISSTATKQQMPLYVKDRSCKISFPIKSTNDLSRQASDFNFGSTGLYIEAKRITYHDILSRKVALIARGDESYVLTSGDKALMEMDNNAVNRTYTADDSCIGMSCQVSKAYITASTDESIPTYVKLAAMWAGDGNNAKTKVSDGSGGTVNITNMNARYFDIIEGDTYFVMQKDLTDYYTNIDTFKVEKHDINLLKLTLPASKLKVGWWWVFVDNAFGFEINNNTGEFVKNTWEHDRTKRWTFHIKNKKEDKDAEVTFANMCEISGGDGNGVFGKANDSDITVVLNFKGSAPYKLNVALYNMDDINEDKIENGLGDATEVLKKKAEKVAGFEKEISISKNNKGVLEYKQNNLDIPNGIYNIPLKDIDTGSYYLMIKANNKNYSDKAKDDKSKYITKWFVIDINEQRDDSITYINDSDHGGSDEEDYTGLTQTEAKRDLTFAEQRKIDEINRLNQAKAENDRWGIVYIVLAFFGMVILAYSLLLIVVYYFDLFNSLTEVSLYHKLTLGNMYPVGSASNIEHLNLDFEGRVKYVTHKTAWFVFVIGVIASAVLMNGQKIVLLFLHIANWFEYLITHISG